MKYGLIGKKLGHSYSKSIHGLLGNSEYELKEIPPEEVDGFLDNAKFKGINVTIPYKEKVMPYVIPDEVSKKIGCVNTVVNKNGKLYGYNTDYYGFSCTVKRSGINFSGKKVIILGSGGTSKTAASVAGDQGAEKIIIISRGGENNYDNVSDHSDADIIINTTPVGMYPNNGVSPINDLGIFRDSLTVIDIIYNPLRTELLLQAEDRGMITANGLSMLVAQAKKAAELFTRASIPDEQVEQTTSKIARLTRNIILIGMPGCGKSSVGAALAEKTGREFADTDDWVVKAAGKSIPDIFAADGEEAFRKLESDALKTLCKRGGLVIATGGGIVKRRENRNALKQNGTVIFLDRDIAELPASGRPLSEKEGAAALAAARLPLYAQWSDHTVPVRGVEQTAADIFRRFTEGALS